MTTADVDTAVQEAPHEKVQGWRAWLRRETGFAAELAALTGFVFARPVLGSFGASPETFIARDADRVEVVAFGLAVVLIPLAVTVSLGAASGVLGRRIRLWVHLAFVAGLGVMGAVEMMRVHTGLPDRLALVVAAALGLGIALLRWRAEIVRTFLRYAGIASVAFLIQFLVFSPASSLVWGARSGGPDPEVTAAVQTALGNTAPPIVMVVFDALPTVTLLDAEGEIHPDVYPNLAALAADGTWYRNHTTVAPDTLHALPAIVTGTLPDGGTTPPVASAYPRNLFTLLGGVYEVNAEEQVTALCPSSLCPDTGGGSVVRLLRDARGLWQDSFEARHELIAGLPGAFGHRYGGFAEWIETQDFSAGSPDHGGDPQLYFYHAMLPHDPWNWLPGGHRYAATHPPYGTFLGRWGPVGAEVGLQRHVLQTQAVDELLGRMIERMREAGVYDDAMIVVTADHGTAFAEDEPLRPMSEGQYEQIAWTPLIVKTPGTDDGATGMGVINDDNLLSLDVLSVIAEGLGIDLENEVGWEVDGLVPVEAARRDPADKHILDWHLNELRPADGDDIIPLDGREGFRRILASNMLDGTGPLAVWQRTTYGELLGADIDDLREGEAAESTLEVENLERFDDVILAEPPLEFVGLGWIEPDETVAVAVNGTLAVLAPARETPFGIAVVHALLHPSALTEGHNELAAYQVQGPPDDPVLHPLRLAPRQE